MDPREKLLRDYFTNLRLSPSSMSRVEKVNLFPRAEHLFLDMDRVIGLGELNHKYKDSYVSVEEFVADLLEGKFSVGSGLSLKLKEMNDKVETLLSDFNTNSKLEQDIIEEDIANLKESFVSRIEEYFEELKNKLQSSYVEKNAEIKDQLVEARNILKEELLDVIETADFFDKNKFYIEFDAIKEDPLEVENFLKDYLNNDTSNTINKTIDEKLKKMSPILAGDFSLDEKMWKYVLSIEKLAPKAAIEDSDNGLILDKFIDSTLINIDSTLKKVKHFVRDENIEGFNSLPPQRKTGLTQTAQARKV